MTKGEIIAAMADFPDEIPVRFGITGSTRSLSDYDSDISAVTEICPTGTDTSENYLLIS